MKKFQLNRNNFIIEKKFHIEKLELDNIIALEYYTPNIKTLINYFNEEYKWDGMFDINDVENRIKIGYILFILYYDKQPIGYVWFKELNKNICFLYNLYVTKKIERPEMLPKWFVNKTCSIMLEHYEKIQCECEDWHTAAQNTFISNGFTIM
jgi:hypothetical protein